LIALPLLAGPYRQADIKKPAIAGFFMSGRFYDPIRNR